LVGVPFPALAFEIVRFAVPARHLVEFTYGGATYDGDVALQRGWVDDLAASDKLMEEAVAAAEKLAALAPRAFAEAKRQIRRPVAERMERSGAATDKTVTEIWAASETLGHIRDYVARTLKKG
jgi:enoyl-CoA hydratase